MCAANKVVAYYACCHIAASWWNIPFIGPLPLFWPEVQNPSYCQLFVCLLPYCIMLVAILLQKCVLAWCVYKRSSPTVSWTPTHRLRMSSISATQCSNSASLKIVNTKCNHQDEIDVQVPVLTACPIFQGEAFIDREGSSWSLKVRLVDSVCNN